jgi:ferredoxin
MPNVIFTTTSGRQCEVSVRTGTTVLEAAKANDLGLAGTCGASLVCATCHVMID